MPYAIGTTNKHGLFEADTLGNEPEATTFPTLEEARAAIVEFIELGGADPDQPLTDAAILDTTTGRIVWLQSEDEGE